MTNSARTLCVLVLLAGCTQSGSETMTENDPSPTANATEPAAIPVAPRVANEPPAPTDAASPIDASELLTTTLAKAKTEDKRVLVHLGAPW